MVMGLISACDTSSHSSCCFMASRLSQSSRWLKLVKASMQTVLNSLHEIPAMMPCM